MLRKIVNIKGIYVFIDVLIANLVGRWTTRNPANFCSNISKRIRKRHGTSNNFYIFSLYIAFEYDGVNPLIDGIAKTEFGAITDLENWDQSYKNLEKVREKIFELLEYDECGWDL